MSMEANVPATKSGMSTTKKVLIGTGLGLGALAVVGLFMPKTETANTTPEPVAAIETPIETKVEWEPAVEPEVEAEVDEAWINEAAAEMAWDQTSMGDRVNICFSWGYDKAAAKEVLKTQNHTKGALKAMYDLFDRECGA